MRFILRPTGLAVVFAFLWALGSVSSAAEAHPDKVVLATLKRTPLEHFILLSDTKLQRQDVLDVRKYLMNVRRDVGHDLRYYPKRKVEVIITQEDTFYKYTGLPGHVVGIYDGRIHLAVPSQVESETKLKSVLWHEYTHALLNEITRGNIPSWLNEGLAVYEMEKILPSPLEVLPGAMRGRDDLPFSMSDINAVILETQNDTRVLKLAYEQSYCFADYLFSRFNRATIRDFLLAMGKTTDIAVAMKETLQLSVKKAERRWLEHIQKMIRERSPEPST